MKVKIQDRFTSEKMFVPNHRVILVTDLKRVTMVKFVLL